MTLVLIKGFNHKQLPPAFGKAPGYIRNADLLIVIGTSLTVHPFASLAEIAPDSCPRVLINIDLVGDFGSREEDVVLLGKCDEVIKDLCAELGWEEELVKLWEETSGSIDIAPGPDTRSVNKSDEKLEEEVAKLAEKIQKQMALAEVTSGETFSTINDNGAIQTVLPEETASEDTKPSTSVISVANQELEPFVTTSTTTADETSPVISADTTPHPAVTTGTSSAIPSAKQEHSAGDP